MWYTNGLNISHKKKEQLLTTWLKLKKNATASENTVKMAFETYKQYKINGQILIV